MNLTCRLLILLGITNLLIIILICILLLIEFVKDLISRIIYRYKRKHRFDKEPVAKCYCRDCVHYKNHVGECTLETYQRWIQEDGFCCFAIPRVYDREKKKEIEE